MQHSKPAEAVGLLLLLLLADGNLKSNNKFKLFVRGWDGECATRSVQSPVSRLLFPSFSAPRTKAPCFECWIHESGLEKFIPSIAENGNCCWISFRLARDLTSFTFQPLLLELLLDNLWNLVCTLHHFYMHTQ